MLAELTVKYTVVCAFGRNVLYTNILTFIK